MLRRSRGVIQRLSSFSKPDSTSAIDSIRDDFLRVDQEDQPTSKSVMKEHRESIARLQKKFERVSGAEKWKQLRQTRSSLRASELLLEWIRTKPQFTEIERLPIKFLRVDASADCSYL